MILRFKRTLGEVMAKGGKGGGGSGGGKKDNDGAPKGTRKDDNLLGTINDDTIEAGLGDDTVDGAEGNDFITGGSGSDSLLGSEGDDRLFGGEGDDTLDGGIGSDELFGGLGNDEVYGGEGDDYLQANKGSDFLDGGNGYDVASFEDVSGGTDGIGVSLTAVFDGTSTIYTGTNQFTELETHTDTLVGIEEVRGTNWDDVMTGGGGEDYFVGAYGKDTLNGAGGDDTLYGSVDDDLLIGGDGADMFVFLRQADGIDAPRPGDPPDFDPADPGYGDGHDLILDFDHEEDVIVFLSNETTLFSISHQDGSTVISYGSASSIVLSGHLLAADDINVLNLVDPDFSFDF